VTPELTAPVDLGWRSMFTGLDLRGWKTNDTTHQHWQVKGERIALLEGSPGRENTLSTVEQFGNAEFILDCRPAKTNTVPSIEIHGVATKLAGAEPAKYNRFTITVRREGNSGTIKVQRNNDSPQTSVFQVKDSARGPLGLHDLGNAIEFMNLYVRDL
jgi:hypothetical protein